MKMLQHDSATMFRFVLEGELTGDRVREFEHAWTAARSILATKALVVEISRITNADAAGVELLSRMRETGARLNAALPPASAEFVRSMGIPVAPPAHSPSTWTQKVLRVFRLSVKWKYLASRSPSPHQRRVKTHEARFCDETLRRWGRHHGRSTS
jgi:ABC-type transporter Mla MlaB component